MPKGNLGPQKNVPGCPLCGEELHLFHGSGFGDSTSYYYECSSPTCVFMTKKIAWLERLNRAVTMRADMIFPCVAKGCDKPRVIRKSAFCHECEREYM